MRKTHHDEQEKQLLKLYREYRNTWDNSKDHGTWVEVTPYQKGWIRFYVLRDDAKNRADAYRLRKVLDLANSKIYSSIEDFTRAVWKKGRIVKGLRENIKQPLKFLNEREYENIPSDIKKYFRRLEWTEKRTYPTKHYVTIVGYVVTVPEYFVFHVEPNIITHHFLPDGEWESRIQEIRNKITRDNLWPKINKAMSKSLNNGHHNYSMRSIWIRNKYGIEFTAEELENSE